MSNLRLRNSLKDLILCTIFLVILYCAIGYIAIAYASKEEYWCLSLPLFLYVLNFPIALLKIWKNRTSLEMDDLHIRLQRRNYTFDLSLHKIKRLMMFKRGSKDAWLFLLQDNNVVRPIDFSSWKYEWTSVKEALAEIAQKNKIPFVFTSDYEEVDALFLSSDAVPNSEVYKVTQKGLVSTLFVCFPIIVLLLSFIFQFAVGGGQIAFVSLLFLCLLALCILFFYAKELRKKESFSLRSAGITVDGHPYRWENFSSIQWRYIDTPKGKYLQTCQICIGHVEVDLPSYEHSELAEQFSYFSKRFVELQEKKF